MRTAGRRALRVIFRVAAGPRCGFGHLVRCRSLALALGVPPRVSIRGTTPTRAVAARMGWELVDRDDTRALVASTADLLVVDDPSASAAERWVARARRAGIPVVSIHDRGLAYVDSDLIVDGSISPRTATGSRRLVGPSFAILHPDFAARARSTPRLERPRVFIALGGGGHVYALASRLCDQISRRAPEAEIRVARGFVPADRLPALANGRWVSAPHGLANELRQASVAVVAGGVSVYEACALGVPTVGFAVTPAQYLTVRSMAARGAVVDGGRPPTSPSTVTRTAIAVAMLLKRADLRARQAQAAQRLVDGQGARRVARALVRLVRRSRGTAALAADREAARRAA